MNFYKHYIGDFQRDTGHLSLTERGAYLALIHHYYATEKPLPNNLDSLCRIAGAVSPIERKAVKEVISFFEVVDSGLMHNRIEAEIHKAGEQANTNKEIALAREAKRRAKKEAEKQAQQENEQSTNRAESVPRNEHENSTNQTPDTRHHSHLSNTQDNSTIVEPTKIGSVCVAIANEFRKLKRPPTDINQTEPLLIALIEAGATVDEFANAARQAAEKKKGFSYTLGIVKRQREDIANLVIHKGALPQQSNYQQGIAVAASSIFKPEHTQHLTYQQPTEIEVQSE